MFTQLIFVGNDIVSVARNNSKVMLAESDRNYKDKLKELNLSEEDLDKYDVIE